MGRFDSRNFQDISGWYPPFFCFRKWVDRVVLFLGVGLVMLALCLLNLLWKYLARPTYVWIFLPPYCTKCLFGFSVFVVFAFFVDFELFEVFVVFGFFVVYEIFEVFEGF